MKNLSPIDENQDVVTKEYVDGLIGDIDTILDSINGEVI